MPNELFIILLISLAVYVLQYIFKGGADKKQQQPGQRRPQGGGPRTNTARPHRQVSDLDRFLEETRKRKEQDESKPIVLAEAPPSGQSLSDTAERQRKAAAAQKEKAAQGQQRAASRAERKASRQPQPVPESPRRPLREQPAPVLLELAPPLASPPPSTSSPTLPSPMQPAAMLPPDVSRLGRMAQPIGATAPSDRKIASPLLNELIRMLRTPRGTTLAVILTEILDTPASRRRG